MSFSGVLRSVTRKRTSPTLIRCINSQPSSSDSHSSKTTSFGFQTVPEDAKESMVKSVFDSVASKYDLMNDAMSMGVHRLWKDEFVSSLKPGRRGPMKCIDVAGGTGDIALRILDFAREKYADRETTVEVVDINAQMLKEGHHRFKKTMYHNCESFLIQISRPFLKTSKQLPRSHFMKQTHRNSHWKSLRITHMISIRSRLVSEIARPSLLFCKRRIGCSSREQPLLVWSSTK